MSAAANLRPVLTLAPRDSSATSTDCSLPPLSAHHTQPKANFISSAPPAFSPIPTSARPRRPLSPPSLRDIDPLLDPDRAFATSGKSPTPLTGHQLMALFPPAPPPIRAGPTSGYFQREERQFFAQAGKEIIRVRIEIDTNPHHHQPSPAVQQQQQQVPGMSGAAQVVAAAAAAAAGGQAQGGPASPSHTLPQSPHHRAPTRLLAHTHQPHPHPHGHPHVHPHNYERERSHDRRHSGPSPPLPPPPPAPHSTSSRSHLPAQPIPPTTASALPEPDVPAHPGYPVHSPPSMSSRPPEREPKPRRGEGGGGGGGGAGGRDDGRGRRRGPEASDPAPCAETRGEAHAACHREVTRPRLR